jgi:serine/threonine-protein kinase HipA
MSDELVVVLGDIAAGVLTRDSAGRVSFIYDDAYRVEESTPLSVSMPVQIKHHEARRVEPWLAGLLPDNPDVVRRWASYFETKGTSPFALLSSPVGRDCAGAARFAPPDELDTMLAGRGTVRWLTEDDVASRLRDLRADAGAWLGHDFTGRFSLAGAQAKTALLRDGDRWGEPTGASATSHILKPAIVGLDDHDLNEHLCLRAAAWAGLSVARSEVMIFGEEQALVVARFDRVKRGRHLQRIHQEDLCQALGVAPRLKYQNEGGPAPADIARLLRQTMPASVADEAVWRFADALVWNWVIGGTDAHAKNYGLLLSGSQVRLTPLYDVASALPYGADDHKLRLAMKLGGDYRLRGQRPNTWITLAKALGVDVSALTARAAQLVARAPAAFVAAADSVAALRSDLPARLVEAIETRAAYCESTLS